MYFSGISTIVDVCLTEREREYTACIFIKQCLMASTYLALIVWI